MQWVKSLRDDLQPFARGAYGPNYAQLVEIKKKYDPNNVLRLNQNINPA